MPQVQYSALWHFESSGGILVKLSLQHKLKTQFLLSPQSSPKWIQAVELSSLECLLCRWMEEVFLEATEVLLSTKHNGVFTTNLCVQERSDLLFVVCMLHVCFCCIYMCVCLCMYIYVDLVNNIFRRKKKGSKDNYYSLTHFDTSLYSLLSGDWCHSHFSWTNAQTLFSKNTFTYLHLHLLLISQTHDTTVGTLH